MSVRRGNFILIRICHSSWLSSYLERLPSSELECLPSSKLECLPSSKLECLPSSELECLPSSRLECLPSSRLECLPSSRLECLPSSQLECLPSSELECCLVPNWSVCLVPNWSTCLILNRTVYLVPNWSTCPVPNWTVCLILNRIVCLVPNCISFPLLKRKLIFNSEPEFIPHSAIERIPISEKTFPPLRCLHVQSPPPPQTKLLIFRQKRDPRCSKCGDMKQGHLCSASSLNTGAARGQCTILLQYDSVGWWSRYGGLRKVEM
jgi:hypothetical protein